MPAATMHGGGGGSVEWSTARPFVTLGWNVLQNLSPPTWPEGHKVKVKPLLENPTRCPVGSVQEAVVSCVRVAERDGALPPGAGTARPLEWSRGATDVRIHGTFFIRPRPAGQF